MIYVLDFKVFSPQINNQLYTVYTNKMMGLIDSGLFSSHMPRAINRDDILLVGIFGNPYSKAITKTEAEIARLTIDKFNKDKVFFLIEDMHEWTFTKKSEFISYLTWYNAILTYISNKEAAEFINNVKTHYVPHHIKALDQCPTWKNRSDEVLVFGDMNPLHYPEREQIKSKLSKNFVLKCIPHPGYIYPNKHVIGDNLNKLIAASKYAMASPSKYNYAVAKYLEIANAGALIVGESCRDIDDMGLKVINNPRDYSETQIRKIVCENWLISQNYCIENYVKRIHAICKV